MSRSKTTVPAFLSGVSLKKMLLHMKTCFVSRVAPLKSVFHSSFKIVRSCILLSQVVKRVKDSLNTVQYIDQFIWCCSTIVLSWINGPPIKWNAFLAIRVGEIQNLSDPAHWQHVRTSENPADLISHGVKPYKVKGSDLWWYRLSWLRLDRSYWPKTKPFKTDTPLEAHTISNVSCEKINVSLLSRFSSFKKLYRLTAYYKRFINNDRVSCNHRNHCLLNDDELNNSSLTVVSISQKTTFKSLLNIQSLPTKSKLISLNSFVDGKACGVKASTVIL